MTKIVQTTIAIGMFTFPVTLWAQPSSTDVSLAETLYRQGRELISQGKYAEACPKFAESRRLDPATGTLLNLAACNEALGKLASAWLQFSEARHLALRDNRQDRVRYADERIAAIEPKLSRLVIEVPPAADVEGLEVRLDGSLIGAPARGVPTPVDPGKHEISAEAPGRKPWKQEIEIDGVADLKQVEIPLLEVLPPSEAPPLDSAAPSRPELRQDRDPLRDRVQTERPIPVSVYVAGGTTLALAVGAGVTGGVYLNKRGTYHETDDDDDKRRAEAWGYVNAGLTAAAVVGAAATGYLYLTRPERPVDTRVSVVPFTDGPGALLSVSGRF